METYINLTNHIAADDSRSDFVAVRQYLVGLGLDVGCGTNRLSNSVLTTDWYPHSHTDLVWNCVHDGVRYHYPFGDDRFDFIFASHVIEDFEPQDSQFVFDEFMRMIKPGGYFVIIVPDMENARYAPFDAVFTQDHPDVISGKRQVGELIGNPSHRENYGLKKCTQLSNESRYPNIVVQADTIPHTGMSLDFVVQKK